MVEFDVGRAISLTYYGLAVAFSALGFLIVFTLLLGLAARWRRTYAAARTAEAAPVNAQEVSILEAVASGGESSLADGFEAAATDEDWKSYGRWEALLSRRVRRRSN